MPADSKSFSTDTYLNPVYPRSFPDPYVIKFRGEYFAYCTDFWHDGRVFGVLRSRDLVNWTDVGGAMQKLDNDSPFYWAPEVVYANGKFYLYYSVGNEALMELRVAVSDRPDGGFIDSGVKLSTEDFAIDAHVFTDTDGQKYLFYATDFLQHSHIGTGTVVDKMTDFFTLEGNPKPVARAKYDWQVYDPHRVEKGGVRWHTVEGPFILKRKGIYYEMFSGGNWQNITYGVSFAVTDSLDLTEEWAQFSDGEKVLPILRTIPETVVGPGHNSVVRGVNNRELYCVYHRWTEQGRVLAVDRMDFAGTRIFIKGATHTPQIAPYQPTFAEFFDEEISLPNQNWSIPDYYGFAENEILLGYDGDDGRLLSSAKAESFLCEFYLRAVKTYDDESGFGFSLFHEGRKNSGAEIFKFVIFPASNQASAYFVEVTGTREEKFDLPADFEPSAFHLVRVECDSGFVKMLIDEANFRLEAPLPNNANSVSFVTENMSAGFSAFSFTAGFEDLFDWRDADVEKHGWRKLSETGNVRVENGELILSSDDEAILTKGSAAENFEFAVNIRLVENPGEAAAVGFLLLDEDSEEIDRFTFEDAPENYYLSTGGDSRKFPLPANFAPENYHQFRFFKLNGEIRLQFEELDLGIIPSREGKARVALFCRNSSVAVEMVRLTIL